MHVREAAPPTKQIRENDSDEINQIDVNDSEELKGEPADQQAFFNHSLDSNERAQIKKASPKKSHNLSEGLFIQVDPQKRKKSSNTVSPYFKEENAGSG